MIQASSRQSAVGGRCDIRAGKGIHTNVAVKCFECAKEVLKVSRMLTPILVWVLLLDIELWTSVGPSNKVAINTESKISPLSLL